MSLPTLLQLGPVGRPHGGHFRHGGRWVTPPGLALILALAARAPAAEIEVAEIQRLLRSGQSAQAEKLSRELMAALSASGKGDSLEAARATDALVASLHAGGKAAGEEAARAARQAVALKERLLGPNHRELASSLNNLALVLREAGEEAQALEELRRARDLWVASDGDQSQIAARAENNIAGLLQSLGDLEGARASFERCIEALGRSPAGESPEASRERRSTLAGVLNNLGMLLVDLGELERAEDLERRALVLWRESTPPGHPAVATALNNLGWVEQALGGLDRARTLYEEALALREATLGRNHPFTLGTVENLGLATALGGDPSRALVLLERVHAARRESLGAEHPLVARSLRLLAGVKAQTGALGDAVRDALAAEAVSRAHLRAAAGQLSEREALLLRGARGLASVQSSGLDLAVWLASRPGQEGLVAETFDAVVRSRALVLDELALRLSHRSGGGADDARLHEDFRLASARYARLLLRAAGEPTSPGQTNALLEARKVREEAELRLAARRGSSAPASRPGAGLREVLEALPAGTALISLYLHSEQGGGYTAFIQAPGAARPAAIDLGPRREIDALVARWLLEAARGLLDHPGGNAESACRQAGDDLRRRVWDPLVRHSGGARRVEIVPDGSLQLVSWGALTGSDGGYLVEGQVTIELLGAERDLIPSGAPGKRGTGLLALGAPPPSRSPGPGAPPGIGLPALPEAGLELEEIVRLWRSKGRDALLLKGREATASALASVAPGREVVHLATHGFFLDPDAGPGETGGLPGARGIGGLRPKGTSPARARQGTQLSLSGLVLAEEVSSSEGRGPGGGVLLAEQAAALQLGDVDLVVLSACETGVGQIRAGEGVLGLRRALHAAGAGSLIMSLWPVDDAATREWMLELHRNLLDGELDTAAASRRASLAVLERRRAAGKSVHPFFWGAFASVLCRR